MLKQLKKPGKINFNNIFCVTHYIQISNTKSVKKKKKKKKHCYQDTLLSFFFLLNLQICFMFSPTDWPHLASDDQGLSTNAVASGLTSGPS
jgi:hypothetical protein